MFLKYFVMTRIVFLKQGEKEVAQLLKANGSGWTESAFG